MGKSRVSKKGLGGTMMLERNGATLVSDKVFLNTFLQAMTQLEVCVFPVVITNISEKRQLDSDFYCLILDDSWLSLSKRFPGKRVEYKLRLSDFHLDTTGVRGNLYEAFVASLRQIMMDIASKEARVLKRR